MLRPTKNKDGEIGADTPGLGSLPGPRSIRDTSATDVSIEPSSRWTRKRIILIAAAVVVLLAAVVTIRAWLTTGVGVSRERVRIAEVTRGPFIRDVAAQGTVIAADSPTLYAQAAGTVTFIARAGDRVKKGQVLGTLDSPTLVNEHQQEKAALDGLNVALDRQEIEDRRQALKDREGTDEAAVQIHAADREFKRAEAAHKEGIIPERDYAKAKDDVDSARLAYEHAAADAKLDNDSMQFELKTKKLERDKQQLLVDNLARRVEALTIRSPVDGMVGSLAVAQKTTVAESAALLTVVNLSALEVEFRVPESYASDLGLDMTAQISYGGKDYAGRVTSISPEVKDSEVTGRVRFADNVPTGLRQNQRVSVRIIMDSRSDVLKVERGAFVDSGGTVYVLDGDIARRRTARLGAISVAEVEILSGLAAGDHIIVSSLSDFNDAPEVRVSN